MESDVRRVGDGSSRSAAEIGGGGSFRQQVVGFCTLTYVLMLAGLRLFSCSYTFTLCVLISRSIDKLTLNKW